MADGDNSGNNGLYFVVGGLVVVVGIGAFLVFGHPGSSGSTSQTTIERSVSPSGDSSTTVTKEKSSSD